MKRGKSMPKVPNVISTGCVKVEYHGPTTISRARWIATNVNTKHRMVRECDDTVSAPEDAAKLASEFLDTKRMYSSSIDGGGWLFMARRDKSPRKEYVLTFCGRQIGALGLSSRHIMHVHARSPKAARLKIYDLYEHVSGEVIVEEA